MARTSVNPRSRRSAVPSVDGRSWLVAALFFGSGALALAYQVVWQRQFALVFGSAAPATAAVLAAFLTGLGAGSAVVGRWARRWDRPLRAYAILEVLIGVGALLVEPILGGFGRVYPILFERLAEHPAAFPIVKGVLALGAVAIPTFCMGGTLPVLAQWIDGGRRHLGVTAGRLYAANTLGAAVGALSVPFLLLPWFGSGGTVALGATANVLVAVVAYALDRRNSGVTEDAAATVADRPRAEVSGRTTKAAPAPAPESGRDRFRFGWAHGAALVSGVVTFALQVEWNRAFAQIHENSVHSFAIIVAVFIVALAAGSELARYGLRHGKDPRRLLGVAWGLGGAGMMAGPWLFVASSGDLALLGTGDGAWGQAGRLAGLAVAVMFVPIAALGTGLPALMEVVGRDASQPVARGLGRLLAVNLAGCVAGALLAGFVLPRWVGLWSSIVLTAGLAVIAGVGIGIPAGARRWRGPRPIALGAAGLAVAGAVVMAGALPRVRTATAQGERVIALAEGTHGIVAVVERPGSRRLKLNNHYALGGTMSVGDQRWQAHLPLLLHPAPRRVGVLGLGTGISAGGTLFHPVTSVDVVELVPEVVEAARAHFADAAAGLFADPRVRLVSEDARNHLRGGRDRYDVLVGDLIVPWRQGEGALFTKEHFEAAREALLPGGVFCQWLPMFQLSEAEVRILLRTFLTVFPRAGVWRGDFSPDRPAIALVGFRDGAGPDSARVGARLREMRPDPLNPQLADPAGFWMNHVGEIEPGDLDPTETRVNREDRPWIELLGPREHGGRRGSALFVGRPLQRWLEAVRARSAGRGAGMTPGDTEAGRAGDRLFEFSLRLMERDEPGARQIRQELESRLPPVVFGAIFGGAGP